MSYFRQLLSHFSKSCTGQLEMGNFIKKPISVGKVFQRHSKLFNCRCNLFDSSCISWQGRRLIKERYSSLPTPVKHDKDGDAPLFPQLISLLALLVFLFAMKNSLGIFNLSVRYQTLCICQYYLSWSASPKDLEGYTAHKFSSPLAKGDDVVLSGCQRLPGHREGTIHTEAFCVSVSPFLILQ